MWIFCLVILLIGILSFSTQKLVCSGYCWFWSEKDNMEEPEVIYQMLVGMICSRNVYVDIHSPQNIKSKQLFDCEYCYSVLQMI